MTTTLKLVLLTTAVAISVFGMLLNDRVLRSRVRKRLSTRPHLSPSDFAATYYRQREADVAKRVRRVLDSVAADLGLDLSGSQPSDDVVKDLSFDDLDSMATVDLVLALENEFNIKITDTEAASMRTVGDIIEFITRKTGSAFTADGTEGGPAA